MADENTFDDNHDDLHDRLIDGALRELVGGQAPPDLGPRILAAASVGVAAPLAELAATHPGAARDKSRFRWGAWAVAVSLLIGTGFLLMATSMNRLQAPGRAASDRDLAESTPANAVRQAPDDDAVDSLKYEYETVRGPRDAAADDDATQAEGRLTLGVGVNSDAGAAPMDGEAPAAIDVAEASAGNPDPVDDGASLADESRSIDAPALRTPATTAPAAGEAGGEPADVAELYVEAEVQLAQQPTPAAEAAPLEEALVLAGDRGGGAAEADFDSLSDLAADAYGVAGGGMGGYGGRGFGRNRGLGEGDGRGGMARGEGEEPLLRAYGGVRQQDRAHYFAEDAGRGPGEGGDQYARIVENPFLAINPATTDNRLSTFSIDVDTASYANVRQFLMQTGMLPPPDAVRIEELVNYFDYDYTPPSDDTPFASNVEVAACPWAPEHRLVRVGIKGREMPRNDRPKSNLVFLIDVSGSMDEPNKLPLLVEGMRMLTRELGENDRVAIVVYASTEGLAMESTRGDQQQVILEALDRLSAGGSTAGGAGIQLAYQVAADNFVEGGVNRVILCTDGDFNVGVTSPAELQRLAESKAKDTGVFLTVLGFGRGNLNDAMMEQVADHGNGNYHYVDNRREARKVLVEEMTGTLITIAKDVKIQIEFNPAHVAAYRLIGYENRVLAAEDFNDDKKDAGEIGAGHMVTALYEIVPAGVEFDARGVDELRYEAPADDGEAASAAESAPDEDVAAEDDAGRVVHDELLTLKIRYKAPDGDESTKLEFPITDGGQAFSAATADFQFAAAVASFGMLLRHSEHAGASTYAGVLEIAESASRDRDPHGYRREFVELVQRARELSGQ